MDYQETILRMSQSEICNFLKYTDLEQMKDLYHHINCTDATKLIIQARVACKLHVDYIQDREPMRTAYAYLNPDEEPETVKLLRKFVGLLRDYATDQVTYLEDLDGSALSELYHDVVKVLSNV